MIYLYHSSLISDVPSPQPQPSSMLDETTTVSSDVPSLQPQSSSTLDETIVATVSSDVLLDLFLPQPSISSPPFEDVDQVHHNQDFDNAGDSHFHHFDCISWSSDNNSDAENLPLSAFNCAISVVCMFPGLTHPQVQIHQLHHHSQPVTFKKTGLITTW